MNDCEKYIELMSQMLDGELSEEQTSELRAHIASCEDCRKAFDAFTSVSEALSDELCEPPEMLAKGVMFKIRNHKKHRVVIGKFTTLAACIALILVGAGRLGLFGGSTGSPVALDAGMVSSEARSAPAPANKSVDSADGAKEKAVLSHAEIQKGVKLEKTNDGTVYQLGFPLQNAELLDGTDPDAVHREPVWLFNAEKLQVYAGSWHSADELAENSGEKLKNDRLAAVDDRGQIDALGELLTSEPDDTTKLTVDSKEFKDSEPVYTIYIPAQTAASQPPAAEAKVGADSDKDSTTKTGSLKQSLESVKNSLLKNADDSKTSASPSPSPAAGDTDEKRLKPPRDMMISVYYVNGEIWCVAQLVDDGRANASAPASAPDDAKVQPSATAPSSETDVTPAVDCRHCRWSRILYKATGSPEDLDAFMAQLRSAKTETITESCTGK